MRKDANGYLYLHHAINRLTVGQLLIRFFSLAMRRFQLDCRRAKLPQAGAGRSRLFQRCAPLAIRALSGPYQGHIRAIRTAVRVA